jgi:lipopolysaccharide/colanic/teichoic acid biosynthesis glycosyltransferase
LQATYEQDDVQAWHDLPPLTAGQRFLKRALDLVCASILVLLFSPLMAAIAVLIKLDSAGPVIFRQARCGYRGKTFIMYKFRSMYVDAGDREHRLAVERWMNGTLGPAADPKAEQIYKLTNDKRITRVGSFLRRTNLDELPQIFNVLKGDMSLVGPRPAMSYEYEQYSEYHKRRSAVPPGITGLWQVGGWHLLSFDKMVELDLQYIRTWSPLQDITIMFKTIPLLLLARGH